MTILQIVGIIALTLLFGCAILYLSQLKGQLIQSESMVAGLYDESIKARQEEGAAKKELEFLKSSIVQLMGRPVIAALNEQQMQTLISAVLTYCDSATTPKEKQN